MYSCFKVKSETHKELEIMKSKKAKQLLLSACFRVTDNQELVWISSIVITGNGTTLTHGRYPRNTVELGKECSVFNFSNSEMTEV